MKNCLLFFSIVFLLSVFVVFGLEDGLETTTTLMEETTTILETTTTIPEETTTTSMEETTTTIPETNATLPEETTTTTTTTTTTETTITTTTQEPTTIVTTTTKTLLIVTTVTTSESTSTTQPNTDVYIDIYGKKTLVIHKPDKYYDEDLMQWVTTDITSVLGFSIVNGNIKASWKDKYWVEFEPRIIYNGNDYSVSQAKTLLKNNYPYADFTIHKYDQGYRWKYALNFSGVPQSILSNITISLRRVGFGGLTLDDIRKDETDIVVKEKFRLGFDDLVNNGFVVELNKNEINITNLHSGWLDPDLSITSGTTTLCGYNNTFDKIEVKSGATLGVCDYNGSPTNCYGGGIASGCGFVNISCSNFTVESGGIVDATTNGYRGGNSGGSEASGYQGESYTGVGIVSIVPNGGGGGGGSDLGSTEGGGGGGGYGGKGGNGSFHPSFPEYIGIGGNIYDTISSINISLGSGGGAGGAGSEGDPDGGDGGGRIIINVSNGNVYIHGIIRANGTAGKDNLYGGGGGGGSGGGIFIYGNNINVNNAIIQVIGGKGGNGDEYGGGGGGGGRIKIFYGSLSNNATATYSVNGGALGTGSLSNGVQGSIGTLYFNQVSFNTIPSISNLKEPTDPSTYSYSTNYDFNATICDANGIGNLNTILFEWNGANSTNVTTYTGINSTCGEWNFTKRDLGVQATTSYKWYANDSSNANAILQSGTFTISKASTLCNLYLNGTEGNKTYNINNIANFTAKVNITGKTVKLDSNYTGWVVQSGTTPLMNYTILATSGNWWNITGYFEGDANYTASSQIYYFNVTDASFTAYLPKQSSVASIETGTPLSNLEFNISDADSKGVQPKVVGYSGGIKTSINFTSEQVESISATPLDSNTFVVAWCDEVADDIEFKIYDTNGTSKISQVTPDNSIGGCSYNSVSISALNSTHFVIGWFDDADDDATFAVYNSVGTLTAGPTDAETSAGNSYSVSVSAFNNTHFVIGWYDAVVGTTSFAVYNSAGTKTAGPIDIESGGSSYSVSVSTFNNTHFVIGWFDDVADDATFAVYNSAGTLTAGPIDIDTDVGVSNSVSVSAFNSTHFVFGWHDANAGGVVRFSVYNSAGTLTAGPTNADTDVGASSYSVSVSAFNSTHFVIGWFDDSDDDATFAVYNSAGTLTAGPTDSSTTALGWQAVTSYQTATNIGICNQNFIHAFVYNTTVSNFTAYYPNGTAWNGFCGSEESSGEQTSSLGIMNFTNNAPSNSINISMKLVSALPSSMKLFATLTNNYNDAPVLINNTIYALVIPSLASGVNDEVWMWVNATSTTTADSTNIILTINSTDT